MIAPRVFSAIVPPPTGTFLCSVSLSLRPRYFKQDSAIEIAARDTLVKGYIKLKLNTTDGVPLDDEEDPDAAAGELTLDKVRLPTRGGPRCRTAVLYCGCCCFLP